ncbi:hypothetical protein HK103_000209 [Boothiomyces macroporosus]|uniref:THO complex subunit 1 n=1 Tax=Boothiomyces macroporosus TaxID=261099 RepID=A0AAD5UKG6_9FUNG|nr:hypothetical protein HK103_000209 [Boothiomyces macroporosus]
MDLFEICNHKIQTVLAQPDIKQSLIQQNFNDKDVLGFTLKSLILQSSVDLDFNLIFKLLDLTIYASELDLIDQGVPLLAIEDLLDVLPVDQVEKVMEYMENRADSLLANLDPGRGKGLTLLRICNELLRRLSKYKHTELCGRILLYLSLVFPISDKSISNRSGTFNTENNTIYEESIEEGDFYNDFWFIQKYFSNPLLLQTETEFSDFSSKFDLILNQFEDILEQERKELKKDDKKEPKKKRLSNGSFFFPKYLTNKALFELQLNDPYFKRQILTQFLITHQFLLHTSTKDKEERKIKFPVKLSDEQLKWLNTSKSRTMKIMDKTSPHARTFLKTVQTILTHEKNWINWKDNSCEVFELPHTVFPPPKAKNIYISKTIDQNYIGNDELSKLWAFKDVELKKSEKTIDSWIKELDLTVAEDLETPLDGIEKEYLLYNQDRFNWLAYRLVKNKLVFNGTDIDAKCPGKTLLRVWREKNGRVYQPNEAEKKRALEEEELERKRLKMEVDQ